MAGVDVLCRAPLLYGGRRHSVEVPTAVGPFGANGGPLQVGRPELPPGRRGNAASWVSHLDADLVGRVTVGFRTIRYTSASRELLTVSPRPGVSRSWSRA